MNKILINYNNLYRYYQIEVFNLKILEEKKESIRSKYFKTTSSASDNTSTKTNSNKDNYNTYMIELEKENILEDIEKQKNTINKLNYYMNKINYNLSELTGIEYRLFYKVINGVNISKAVDEVVSENCYNNKKPQDTRIIWKKYYPNVKREIDEFNNIQKEIQKMYETEKSTVKVQ